MAVYTTIRELQAGASRLIADTPAGEPLVVTSHGRPVAILVATRADEADDMASAIMRLRSYRAFKSLQAHVQTRPAPSCKSVDSLVRRVRRSR